jgi:hypothetical protein
MRCPTAPRNACAMELEGIISKRRDPDPEVPRRCTGAPSRAASGDPYRRCVPHPCGSTLTLAENALDVLYPFLTGVAIDALLAGAWSGVAPLLIAWTVHLFVGLFRHVYDTRVFTLVYAKLASDLVERQRAQGADAAHLAARVALSREMVDFLQVEVPAAAASVVRFVGAIA